jgi:hypothetical protein
MRSFVLVIVAVGSLASASQELPQSKGKPLPIDPCCGITGIDTAGRKITGKVTATGETFTLTVSDGAVLDRLHVGDALDFTPDPARAAKASSAAGGTTTQGNNAPRNSDTRPKDCIATTSSGQEIKVACPSGVPIKTKK